MLTKSARPSIGTIRHEARKVPWVRSLDIGSRLVRHSFPVLVAVTVSMALVGGLMAARMISVNADGRRNTHAADGRVSTSFGALWIESSKEVTLPKMVQNGMFAMPQGGSPDKVLFEVIVGIGNTTAEPVELTPARFALRLEPDRTPISVEAASFDSVRLLPGATFDAQMQFPVKGGEHQVSLLFDDSDGAGLITIDLGPARFEDSADSGHEGH